MGCDEKYTTTWPAKEVPPQECEKNKIRKVWEGEALYDATFMQESTENETLGCLNDLCCLGTTIGIKMSYDNLSIAAIMIRYFLM